MDKNTVPIGYTTNLQTRGNAAEILVILEKTSNNEILYKELLMNSMKLIRNLMKEKGIEYGIFIFNYSHFNVFILYLVKIFLLF